jgi:hypothetical protein
MTRYKCLKCLLYIDEEDLNENKCPVCNGIIGEDVIEACVNDHPCTCGVDSHASVVFCEICGQPICPGCGSHDVVAISRVTGYLQEVNGFNAGKKQELKDRNRHTVA